MPSIHLIITGHVQGVFFRAHCKEKALDLGLTGWVRNAEDESVEVHAEGPQDALDALKEWCHEGPEAARVDEVHEEESHCEECVGFIVRY